MRRGDIRIFARGGFCRDCFEKRPVLSCSKGAGHEANVGNLSRREGCIQCFFRYTPHDLLKLNLPHIAGTFFLLRWGGMLDTRLFPVAAQVHRMHYLDESEVPGLPHTAISNFLV